MLIDSPDRLASLQQLDELEDERTSAEQRQNECRETLRAIMRGEYADQIRLREALLNELNREQGPRWIAQEYYAYCVAAQDAALAQITAVPVTEGRQARGGRGA